MIFDFDFFFWYYFSSSFYKHEKKTYQSSWYRAQVSLSFHIIISKVYYVYDSELFLVLLQIQTVTSLMDASTTVDVFLIDYGTEEKNVKFPR